MQDVTESINGYILLAKIYILQWVAAKMLC